MVYTKIKIKLGDLVACINKAGGLVGLWFEGQKHFPKISSEAKWLTDDEDASPEVLAAIDQIRQQLKAYEKGKLKAFDLKLAPVGTHFQTLVWNELLHISYGQTSTYGAIGKKVAEKLKKKSMSAQAVGNAVGRNPITILIPCHRVVGADGSLTGYAGGLDKKRSLLALEGVLLDRQLKLDV